MKEFFKKNKFVIFTCVVLLILLFSYIYTVSANTYESIDFKYGKVKTKSTLNIRCGPGTTYERVGKLNNEDYIKVFAKVGEWYIIQTKDNIVGAVSSKYVEAIYNVEEAENFLNNIEDSSKNEESVQTSSVVEESNEYIDKLELTSEEKEFLNLINTNRKKNGLEELKIDNTVQNVARLKAQDLERNDYFSHNSPSYGNIDDMLTSFGVTFSNVQENIAGNQNLAGAVEAWMNSESHKSNILNKDFEFTGVAIANSSMYGKIFVEVFVKK